MSTTRQSILDYIQSKRTATAREISYALKVTPANIRHHLSILLAEGVVEVAGKLTHGGRGRPRKIYALTRQSEQHSLDHLASTLLTQLTANRSAPEKEAILRNIAARLAHLSEDQAQISNLTQRLYLAVQRLNSLNYQARWEARAASPTLTLGHCPYALILEAHPELCIIDRYLLEALLNTQVTLTHRLETDMRGLTFCRFMVAISGKTNRS